MFDVKLALMVTKDPIPEICFQVIIDGVPIMDPKVITAEVMSAVSTKILAQGGKGFGSLVNTDGSISDRIKFTASKVETI